MKFQPSEIAEAAVLIQKGELIAFPTETVYGLGASVFLPAAIQKIFTVKGRPQDNPLIVHIASLSQLTLVAKDIPDDFYLLAEAFFPGPLTVLLKKKECVPDSVSAGLETIGVRMPAHPIAQQLIDAVGVPLVAPSANISGAPSSTTAEHVLDDFGDRIAGVVDGGACSIGIESTVMALDPTPTILRPGAITAEAIESVLKKSVHYEQGHSQQPRSPGMKYRHYAPKAKVRLFYLEEEMDEYLKIYPASKVIVLKQLKNRDFYALLRLADQEGKDEIVILCDEATQKNSGLMNRILRASQ